MKIDFTEKVLKDTFYSLMPINWLLRITALSNIYRDGIQLAQSVSIVKNMVYVMCLLLLNIFCLYHKMKTFAGNLQAGLVKFNDLAQTTYWLSYFEYVIDMYIVHKFGRVSFLKYFKTFDHIDVMLGFSCYDNIRRTVAKSVVFSIILCLFSSVFDLVAWSLFEGWQLPTLYSVDYLYFFLNMLTVLDIISHAIQVEYRLKVVRDLLLDYNNRVSNPIDEEDNITFATNMQDNKPLDSLKTLCYTKYLKTSWFTQCYLLLMDQVNYLNTSYGWRVLVYCLNFLTNMIYFLNSAIRLMNGRMNPTGNGDNTDDASLLSFWLPTLSCLTRAMNYEVMVIILIHRYEQTYRQSEQILDTIDKILASKNTCDDMKNNLLEFRNLLITRPIKFHAAKFFNIDYTLFVSLNSAIVTYTIIMLQSMQ